MSAEIRNLEPKTLWNHFADLNAVPRPSKKEERVIQFMVDFGKKLGLPTSVDEVGNVLIKKPGQGGLENHGPVALQSHLDMVHQKNNDTTFDFDSQGIEMFVDGDWVKAKGTTLGADNGIGVAAIMSLLSSTDLAHPPLEALFTIDEETGMTGAKGLKGGLMDAKVMLNLDTEEDTDFTIGCAGGVDVTGTGDYKTKKVKSDMLAYSLAVKGLTGGHSGMEIHLGRGNANKLINRLMYGAEELCDMRISSIDGGGLRNAIPRESVAVVTVPKAFSNAFENFIQDQGVVLQAEYATTDPGLQVTLEKVALPSSIMARSYQWALIRAIYAIPNGIYRMSPDIQDLVQTSNNLARVIVKDGEFSLQCLTRSSVDSEKWDLANAIGAAMELASADVVTAGDYPGWKPVPSANIVKVMGEIYEKRNGKKPHVLACHAGLECGILGTNYPEMEMISFGPNIMGAHSPDERTQISSVQKFWGLLVDTLQQL